MKNDKITLEQQKKINLIALLEDLQDQYISELQPDLRQGMKKMINNASMHTKSFIRYCDRIFGKESQESFGITADEIRKIIDEIYMN